jgi:hypothetical protein
LGGVLIVQFFTLAQGSIFGLRGDMASIPRDPSDMKQPIIWGNVIGILVFHLLALYALVTLPLTEIRWQTYLWGESLAFQLIMSVVTVWTSKAMSLPCMKLVSMWDTMHFVE